MKNKLLAISLTTISCLYGILAAVIILAFALAEIPISYAILLSIFIIIIQFLIAPSFNDWIFKHFYNTTFDCEIPEYLKEFISESCRNHNMKYPKIGFINDGSPNAFTYGRTKNDARIVITRGILTMLTPEEAKAVVAHELGHATHYDMLFMTAAQIVPLVLYYVAEVLMGSNSKKSSNNDNNNNSYGALIGLIAYILYILSQYIILGLSRTREYYADDFAIEETRNPAALANALVKIGFGLAIGSKDENSKLNNGNALGISNPKTTKGIAIGSYNNGGVSKENVINAMKWERWNTWAKLNELNSTHPLISKRLLAISNRCEEYGQVRYIEFNEEKPESYVPFFIKEILLFIAPWIIAITTFFLLIVSGDKVPLTLGIGGIIFVLSLFAILNKTHKNKEYVETNIAELLGEVKVSNITSIPCVLKGEIIGRGNPGCIFNEDYVIQDETGIIFLDYNQPLHIIEKIFAIFKSEENFNKQVVIKGWYRRSSVPYVEVHSIEVDGKIKKCHTYKALKVFYWILMILSIISVIYSFLA